MRYHIRCLFLMPAMMIILTNCQTRNPDPVGTFGHDKSFFENHHIDFVELKDHDGVASLLVVPAYQGRVMTSTAGGN